MDIDAILLAAKGPKGDNGDPTLSADLASTDPGKGSELVSRGSVTVASFAGVAGVPAEAGQRGISINLASYHPNLNKGGGVFTWDATSIDSDDGGVIVTPSGHSDPGRWVRQLDGYVTPEMFGAKGDGVTDDTPALNGCHAAAEARTTKIVWQALKYRATSSVIVGPTCQLDASKSILVYEGVGIGLDIQGVWDVDSGVTRGDNICILPFVTRPSAAWDAGTDTTSVGVRIADRKMTTFYVRGIRFFDTGLQLSAKTANHVCNTYHLGYLVNNRVGIDFGDIETGWGINQNQFIGGQIRIDTIYNNTPGRICINMPNVGENNTNLFLGVNLEQGAQEKAIFCASTENVFINCRFEGSSATPGYVEFTGNRNKIIGGAPLNDATPLNNWILDTGFGNQYWIGYRIASKRFSLDFSQSLPLRFGNGISEPAVPIGGFGTDGLALGSDSTTNRIVHSGLLQQSGGVVSSGTTLPARSALVLDYSSPQTITGLTPGVSVSGITGVITIASTNSNATLAHTSGPTANALKFVLSAGVDLNLSPHTPVQFMIIGGNLYQI